MCRESTVKNYLESHYPGFVYEGVKNISPKFNTYYLWEYSCVRFWGNEGEFRVFIDRHYADEECFSKKLCPEQPEFVIHDNGPRPTPRGSGEYFRYSMQNFGVNETLEGALYCARTYFPGHKVVHTGYQSEPAPAPDTKPVQLEAKATPEFIEIKVNDAGECTASDIKVIRNPKENSATVVINRV